MEQTIYEIMGDYNTLFEMSSDEEMPKELFEQMLKDTKESIDFSLEEKAYSYAKVCKNLAYNRSLLEGQEKFLKEELERLQSKIKSSKSNEKCIKDTLLEAMQLADIPRFKNDIFTIYQSKNISVEVLDCEKALKQDLASIEIKPDKDKIKRKLQSGENLDFAKLKESKFLVIK
ncbi:siphovirus Gp157 family protein [uncultured Tyzzerella sp.]|uniref:siphovirus Gp157 family protein n=1 Tax=uncultured Tyzzerella sp. TaxID=2321398 RepID=UPI002942F570|nr:siphovirus Gp157 family protein [uncultured Tyzzerella sp.]